MKHYTAIDNKCQRGISNRRCENNEPRSCEYRRLESAGMCWHFAAASWYIVSGWHWHGGIGRGMTMIRVVSPSVCLSVYLSVHVMEDFMLSTNAFAIPPPPPPHPPRALLYYILGWVGWGCRGDSSQSLAVDNLMLCQSVCLSVSLSLSISV